MTTSIDQYTIETTWSTRITDDIVLEAIQGDVPQDMEVNIMNTIAHLNNNKWVDDKEIYIKLMSLILIDHSSRPIQAIATQIGHLAGINSPTDAFEWGMVLLKDCRDVNLYKFKKKDHEWRVYPNFTLDSNTKDRIAKLQFLPPMKKQPKDWKDNYNGGWLWENKHLVLGNKFTKHEEPLAYDVINKLQKIAWEIDADTYLFEKQTNTAMDKKQFLRVIDQYLGQHFYFVWRYDSRGRSYSSGYDLNLQTNEYGKALLSLHKKEVITQLPNLYIAIANHAGKDKLTWQERIDWVTQQNIDDIEWDEPILGRKAIRALKATVEGKPTGYVMSVDATSSGIQIMAVLSGDKQTAKLVNCIDPNERHDLYSDVATMMSLQLKKPVPRSIVKQCTMTHYYNSKATPRGLLSEEELEVFYQVIEGLLPGAEEVMATINGCWNNNADAHSWVMPDGHKVYVPVVEGINGIYSDEEFGDIPLRWYRQTKSNNYRSLCPNVIHSIDGYVAREMIRRSEFQLSHIHDCFVFNPNHLQKVCQTYKEIMAELACSDIFVDILSQITGKSTFTITKASTDLDKYILQSNYMLS